jgi:signal transduction histidine kinase
MKFLHPDSIAGRTMIVLLVGLTLSHIASMALLSTDRHDAMISAGERLCADRVAVIARMLDRATPGERSRLIADLGSPTLTVAVAAMPAVAADHHDEDELSMVGEAFGQYFAPVGHPRLHVVHRTVAGPQRPLWSTIVNGFPRDRAMEVSFRLTDGSWANFDIAMAGAATLWSPHIVASTLVMMIAIVVLGAWAAGWIGRPLAAFAKAADRLGRDVAAPPLAEGGPREVRHAVAAFNEMQGRIRRFVEDRTRLLAAISHDLRSPITRLRLRTELLAEGEPRQRMLADLDEMEAMVASTLDFARVEAADEPNQSIDLAATLQTICDNASDMGLPSAYAWEGRLVCACRPVALKRALANLVENGARYGGQADVSTLCRNGAIVVIIEDAGPGIAAAEMEKVFAPFYRLEGSRNRRTGGVGLGMTVARTIIRAHGGDISLENRPEGGLRVIVILPQDAAPADGGAA